MSVIEDQAFYHFLATSLMNSKITRARVLDSKSHHINNALIMICHAIYILMELRNATITSVNCKQKM